jgi:hypothetical protein
MTQRRLRYELNLRIGVPLDGCFRFGGSTSVDGLENSLAGQMNSRLGGTASALIAKRQSLKFANSKATHGRFSGIPRCLRCVSTRLAGDAKNVFSFAPRIKKGNPL